MNATSIFKAYSEIAILMGTLLISLGLPQAIDADGLPHGKPTTTTPKGAQQEASFKILKSLDEHLQRVYIFRGL